MLFPTLIVAAVLHCAGTDDPRCPLFGDVDGDGRADAVWIARRGQCAFTLVAKSRRGILRAPLAEPLCRSKPAEFTPFRIPRVVALRPMTAARGLEVEVLLWSSASNDTVRFLTVRDGRLHTMRDWDLGGFAAAYSLTDCRAPHVVLRASRWFDGRRWHGRTVTYRVTRSAFVRTATVPVFEPMRDDAFRRCHGVERAPRYP